MKRYVKEYAADKIRDAKKYYKGPERTQKIEHIEMILAARTCEKISDDQAVKLLAGYYDK